MIEWKDRAFGFPGFKRHTGELFTFIWATISLVESDPSWTELYQDYQCMTSQILFKFCSIDWHRAWQDAGLPRELNSEVFQLPRVSVKSYKQRIPHVTDVTVHQNSFGPNLSQQAPHASVKVSEALVTSSDGPGQSWVGMEVISVFWKQSEINSTLQLKKMNFI